MENGDLSQPTYFVEEDKIAHNIAVLKNRVGQRRIYAVLKADGYGLGVEKLASVYAANGLDCFAVTDLQQVRAVAKSVKNIRELLLMSAPMPQQIPELAELQVSFSVSTREQLRQLEPYSVNVHLQVDTGLGRRGFPWTDIPTILRQYTETENVHFVGIYTHLIDGGNTKTTQLQMQRFSAVLLDVTDVACEVSDVARLNINPIFCRDMPICWLPKSEEK